MIKSTSKSDHDADLAHAGISGAVASVATGLLLGRLRPASVMTIALAAFLVGTILIATASPDQIYWGQTFFATMVISWGMV